MDYFNYFDLIQFTNKYFKKFKYLDKLPKRYKYKVIKELRNLWNIN